MTKNKITFAGDRDSEGRAVYYFTGSSRQPTLLEISNYIWEKGLASTMEGVIGITAAELQPEEYAPPEENLTVRLWGYDVERCCLCGQERDLSKDVCPVCQKPW